MAFNREKTLATAQKHLRKGNVDRAIREYERLLDEDPSDIRSKLKMADLLVKADRFDDALAAYGQVAYAYASDDLYEKAAAVYKQALRIAPEDPELHQHLGEAYFRLGRLKDAVRVFHKAQKIYKQNQDAPSQRAVLERMVAIDPDDVGLRIQLAERNEKDGLRQEALNLFGDAATQLKEEGRLDEFVQVAERIIFLQPDLFEMRKEVVRIYLGRGDEKHALKHLQHCFKVNPQDIETLELLGSTFHRLGANEKAALVYAELAALYERPGEPPRASSAYRTILNIDPDNARARQFLGENQAMPTTETTTAYNDSAIMEEEDDGDALDGIEFLDDDDDDDDEIGEIVELTPTDQGNQNDSFIAFAEDTIRDLETDAALDEMDAYPQAALGDEHTAAAVEISESSLEMVDAPPAETEESLRPADSDDQIHQFLTESEVFLKYGLLDRAEDVITKVLQLSPDNLGGRDQMRKLLERMGDKRGAAHQLVEMARISRRTPDRANAYLRQASSLVDEDVLRTLANGAGLELDAKTLDVDVAPEFITEVSEGLEEISSLTTDHEEELGAHSIDLDEGEVDELHDLFLENDDLELSGNSAVSDAQSIPEIDAASADMTVEDFSLDVLEEDAGSDLMEVVVDDDLAMDDFDLSEAELELDADLSMEGADIMDLDFGQVDFDESELAGLDGESEEEIDFDISAEDADAMFDELFGGGMFDSEPDDMGLGAEELSESEAFDIPEFDEEPSEGVNHFGSRSLSQKFPVPQTNPALTVDASSVNNSSLELGKTYQDMGLYSEAIEEFRHALEDPDAAPAALYNIAICHIELGETDDAQENLSQLTQDESAPNGWRMMAHEKLEELTA